MKYAVVACLISLSLSLAAQSPAQAQFWKNLLNGDNSYGSAGGFNNQAFGNQGWGNQNYAPSYNQNNTAQISSALRDIERSSDRLQGNVQSFLTSRGRWLPAPQGNDAALIMTLDSIKSQARQARRAADSNDSNRLFSQLTQLQAVTGNASNIARQAGLDVYTVGQLQVIETNVRQVSMMANVIASGGSAYPGNYGYPGGSGYPGMPGWNGGGYPPQPSHATGYLPQSGYLQASSSGRGQFTMMGQVFMNIRNATIQASDPVSRQAVFTISAGRDTINLLGTLVSQTPNNATINITGSDRGAASGMITGTIGRDGSLTSANGNGTLNGQGFVVSFRSN